MSSHLDIKQTLGAFSMRMLLGSDIILGSVRVPINLWYWYLLQSGKGESCHLAGCSKLIRLCYVVWNLGHHFKSILKGQNQNSIETALCQFSHVCDRAMCTSNSSLSAVLQSGNVQVNMAFFQSQMLIIEELARSIRE